MESSKQNLNYQKFDHLKMGPSTVEKAYASDVGLSIHP